MKFTVKKLAVYLLALALLVGLVPGMSPAARAEGGSYTRFKNTTTVIKFDDKDWYLINYDDSTVTLLSKECVGKSMYNPRNVDYIISYDQSDAKVIVDQYYNNFSDAAKKAVSDGKMFLLTRQEARNIYDANINVLKCPKVSTEDYWWTCTNGGDPGYMVAVRCEYYGEWPINSHMSWHYECGVRPALKLKLDSVTFSYINLTGGGNATASGGATTQAYFDCGNTRSAMTTVTYTANSGYYFPEDYPVSTVNGITVTRDSYTQITVSGTPTAETTEIELPAATAKTTPDAPTTPVAVRCTDANNNDGKLTGVTAAMEYKKSDAQEWTAITGSDVTGLVPGTYYVRIKETYTTNASANQELIVTTYNAATPPTLTGWSGAYDTYAHSVTAEGQEGGTVNYSTSDDGTTWSDWSETVPSRTNVGVTYVKAYTKADEAHTDSVITEVVEINISKGDPTATPPTGLTATYGQKLSAVSLEGKNPESNTEGTWAWADGEQSVGEAGEHTFKANFTPDDTDNYNSKTNLDVTVTVEKADPTAAAPTGLKATYGQTLSEVTLTNPDGNTPGSWAWADGTQSVGNAGENPFQVNFTPTDATNYNTVSASVTVTVEKADPTANPPTPTAIYGQTLSQVALENPTGNTAGRWTWVDDGATSVGDPGDHTFKASFAPDDDKNYDHVSNVVVTVTVNKAVVELPAIADMVYTGKKQIPVVPENDLYDIVLNAGGTAVGEYSVVLTLTDSVRYKWPDSDKPSTVIQFRINKADPTVTAPTAKALAYNGQSQELVTAGEAEGGEMQYAIGTATEATGTYGTAIPTATDIETYYVWYRVVGDDNHESTDDLGPVEVALAPSPEFGEPDFILPEQLKVLDESAFEGVTSLTIVDAHNCTSIGKDAFKGTGLKQIRLPKDCEIDAEAFGGQTVCVYAPAGGTTEAFCADYDNLVFIAEAE